MIDDAQGTPLLVRTTTANVRDDRAVPAMLEELAARGLRVAGLHGDRGYGFAEMIRRVAAAGIEPVLAERDEPPEDHGSGLGAVRGVVEQTLANLGHCRRIKLCYERTGAHFQAFNELAAILLCFKRLVYYGGCEIDSSTSLARRQFSGTGRNAHAGRPGADRAVKERHQRVAGQHLNLRAEPAQQRRELVDGLAVYCRCGLGLISSGGSSTNRSAILLLRSSGGRYVRVSNAREPSAKDRARSWSISAAAGRSKVPNGVGIGRQAAEELMYVPLSFPPYLSPHF